MEGARRTVGMALSLITTNTQEDSGTAPRKASVEPWVRPKGHLLLFCSHITPKHPQKGDTQDYREGTKNCSWFQHSSRDQRVADTVSRRLITQRSLVQIQPPQPTTTRVADVEPANPEQAPGSSSLWAAAVNVSQFIHTCEVRLNVWNRAWRVVGVHRKAHHSRPRSRRQSESRARCHSFRGRAALKEIFIGSSKEGLEQATQVVDVLSEVKPLSRGRRDDRRPAGA